MWVGVPVPLWGYFLSLFFWAVFSLHVEAIFSVCCGRVFLVCPPPNFFCWNPYNCYHIFFTSQIFIFLPDRGGLNFLGNLFFYFLGGGGLRKGCRLLSIFRLFLREHAGPGGGGGVIG